MMDRSNVDLEKQSSADNNRLTTKISFSQLPTRDNPSPSTSTPQLAVPSPIVEAPPRRPSTPYPNDDDEDEVSPTDKVPPKKEAISPTSTAEGSVTTVYDDEPTWPKGWRPWACLFGCFLLMWNSWGIVNAYGTFQSYYSQHLFADTSLMLLNLIGSTQSFVVLVFSFVVGRLLDANYARWLIGIGAFLVTLGHFLLSIVNGEGLRNEGNYGATWATQGLVVGLGQACFFVSSSQIASTWFIKRKAVAIGIVASGASIAGLVYPIMVKFLITEVGFNSAVRYTGILIGVSALTSFLLCVPNPSHIFRKPSTWRRTSVWIDTPAFHSPPFLWFTASICFVFFGFYAVFFNLEDWAAYNGFAQKDAPPGLNITFQDGEEEVENDAIRTFWLLCIMNVSSTAGRLFSACFAERFGALNIHTITTLLGSLLLLLLWPFSTILPTALLFVIIFGAISGSIIGLPPASIAHILGRTSASAQSKLGQWTGMMYTSAAPFALTGPVIAGYLVQYYGPNQYLAVQMWSGACLLLACVCMALARYYSGPSRTVDVVRRLSFEAVDVVSRTITFSRHTTLDREGGSGGDGVGQKPGFLTGLGKKIVRSRQGSAEGEGGASTGVSGAGTTMRKEVESADLRGQISEQVLRQIEIERSERSERSRRDERTAQGQGQVQGIDSIDYASRSRRRRQDEEEMDQTQAGEKEEQKTEEKKRPALIRAPLTG